MLQTEDISAVSFSIVGNVICPTCKAENFPAGHMEVDLASKNDPTQEIDFQLLEKMGPFGFSNLRFRKGAVVTITTAVFKDNSDTMEAIRLLEGSADIRLDQENQNFNITIEVKPIGS